MIVDRPRPRALVNAIITSHLGTKAISVLEAGGGSRSRVSKARNINIRRITTLDIDKVQLERNNYADVKIHADLQDFRSDEKYDLIEVVNVLEHVEHVDKALINIANACSDDGLVVIGSPYMYSFSGIVTRFTPHWFHVLFRKAVLGEANAGKEGFPPFKTFYNPLIAPGRMNKFLTQMGFSTELIVFFESTVYQRSGLLKIPIFTLTALINIVTPKSYNARNGEYCMVFRKVAPVQAGT